MIKSFSVVRVEAGVNFAELDVKHARVLRLRRILTKISVFDPSFSFFYNCLSLLSRDMGVPMRTFAEEVTRSEFVKSATERTKALSSRPPEAYPEPGEIRKANFAR